MQTEALDRWLSRVDDLALSSTAAHPREESSYLEWLDQLIDERPAGANVYGLCRSPRRSQRAARRPWRDGGDAAIDMLPDEAGFMISRAAPDTHIASVLLEGQGRESTSMGRSLALAMVGAVALSLVESHGPPANSIAA